MQNKKIGKMSEFKNGDLIMLTSPPAAGKTTFAINIIENTIINDKEKVIAFFSLETSYEELFKRVAFSIANINLGKSLNDLSEAERKRFQTANAKVVNSKLNVDDDFSMTTNNIISKSLDIKNKNRGKLDLIIIDYLELLSSEEKFENRKEEKYKVLEDLKKLAVEINCPVIINAQLSKKWNVLSEFRSKIPTIEEIQDDIKVNHLEKLVDFILCIVHIEEQTEEKRKVFLCKIDNSNGQLEKVEFTWDKKVFRFNEIY